MTRNTCDQCRYWHKGYLLHRSRMPATCNYPGEMHSTPGDSPACKDFAPRAEAEGGEA